MLNYEQKTAFLAVFKAIGYASTWEEIHNPNLFFQALTHKSYNNEHQEIPDNKILAFIGDEVLDFCVTRKLVNHFSNEGRETAWFLSSLQVGDYSWIRSNLVSRKNLSKIALEIGLTKFICAGENFPEEGIEKDNVPGETLESLLGACALDSFYDLQKMDQVVSNILDLDDFLKDIQFPQINKKRVTFIEEDAKNPLCTFNKLFMKRLISKPTYSFDEPLRCDNGKELWKCSCLVKDYPVQESSGYFCSKKDAKMDVAKRMIDLIMSIHPEFFCKVSPIVEQNV